MDKLSFAVLIVLLPSLQKGEILKCIYGEHRVCGSDGVTYLNRCDLEIVSTVHPYLNFIHYGSCKSGVETIDRILNFIDIHNNVGSLRRNRKPRKKYGWWNIKPRYSGNKLNVDLKNVVLSQYYDSLTTLSAFNMGSNNLSTAGDNNVFQISFGAD